MTLCEIKTCKNKFFKHFHGKALCKSHYIKLSKKISVTEIEKKIKLKEEKNGKK